MRDKNALWNIEDNNFAKCKNSIFLETFVNVFFFEKFNFEKLLLMSLQCQM